jgi:hypothetical protein
LQRCLFQKGDHTIAQQHRVVQVLHGHRPVPNALHVEEVCVRAKRQKQMIELELERESVHTTCAE